MEENTKAVASDNPCIQVYSTTTKRVVLGVIMGPNWGGCVRVEPYVRPRNYCEETGVEMVTQGPQIFSKHGLKHLIARLTEICEVL